MSKKFICSCGNLIHEYVDERRESEVHTLMQGCNDCISLKVQEHRLALEQAEITYKTDMLIKRLEQYDQLIGHLVNAILSEYTYPREIPPHTRDAVLRLLEAENRPDDRKAVNEVREKLGYAPV